MYLTLKDAGAQLQAVMFKFIANTVKFELKDGMEVLAFGSITRCMKPAVNINWSSKRLNPKVLVRYNWLYN